MQRIKELLDQKNHYLEKFYALNEKALQRFNVQDFEGIEHFYETREQILEIIRYLDADLSSLQSENKPLSADLKKEVIRAMAIKDEYVSRILAQDLEILSCIESAKSSIIRELSDLQRSRKAISGYKSPNFKKRLDEEL